MLLALRARGIPAAIVLMLFGLIYLLTTVELSAEASAFSGTAAASVLLAISYLFFRLQDYRLAVLSLVGGIGLLVQACTVDFSAAANTAGIVLICVAFVLLGWIYKHGRTCIRSQSHRS